MEMLLGCGAWLLVAGLLAAAPVAIDRRRAGEARNLKLDFRPGAPEAAEAGRTYRIAGGKRHG